MIAEKSRSRGVRGPTVAVLALILATPSSLAQKTSEPGAASPDSAASFQVRHTATFAADMLVFGEQHIYAFEGTARGNTVDYSRAYFVGKPRYNLHGEELKKADSMIGLTVRTPDVLLVPHS